MRCLLLLVLVSESALFCQIGQYPGGGYPPGQYPGSGGSGLPFPRRGKGKNGKPAAEVTKKTSGALQKIDDKTVVIEAEDGRVLEYRRTEKTKFLKRTEKGTDEVAATTFKTGDTISVESVEDKDGNLEARNVMFEKSAPESAATASAEPGPRESAPAGQSGTAESSPAGQSGTYDAPAASRDPEDPGPPELRRGAPARKRRVVAPAPEDEAAPVAVTGAAAAPAAAAATDGRAGRESVEREPAAPAQAAADETDPLIDKARAATESYAGQLPNYVCTEYMARFYSSSHPVNWQPLDVVSTELVYEKGQENYRNVAVNGKQSHKKLEEIGGSWSTGEFVSILRDVFSRSTAAEFHQLRESTAAGQRVRIYSFYVERPHSHWEVHVPSQMLKPAYKGTVWISPSTGHVLRIETQARKLPEEFPLDTVESAVDYDYVSIGGNKFLLPAHAETLSCQRGSSDCTRNVIDFRNYHKFNADSNVTFGGS